MSSISAIFVSGKTSLQPPKNKVKYVPMDYEYMRMLWVCCIFDSCCTTMEVSYTGTV